MYQFLKLFTAVVLFVVGEIMVWAVTQLTVCKDIRCLFEGRFKGIIMYCSQ